MVLCCIMLFSVGCNVKPEAAHAAGTDVAMIGLTISSEGAVQVTLQDLGGDCPDSAAISYYQDGTRVQTETYTLNWSEGRAVITQTGMSLGTSGHLTAIVSVEGDTNLSNNNRTVSLSTRSQPVSKPGKVTGVTVGNVTQNSIQIKWNAVSGADQYRITCGTSVYYTTGTSYTVMGLNPGTNYSFTIDAYNSAGYGTASDPCSGTTESVPETTQPSEPEETTQPSEPEETGTVNAPSNFRWTFLGPNRIELVWDAPAAGGLERTEYLIEQKTSSGQTQYWHPDDGATSYSVTDLTANTSYTFQIWARHGSNVLSTPVQQFTVKTPAAVTEDSNGQPDLTVTDITWTPSDPEAGEGILFTAEVKNIGTKSTNADTIVGVLFKIGSSGAYSFCDTFKGPLAPGETVLLTANGGSNGKLLSHDKAENTTVSAQVDDVNRVPNESDENNNTHTKPITIQAYQELNVPNTPTPGAASDVVVTSSWSNLAKETNVAVEVNNQTSAVFKADVNNGRYYSNPMLSTMPITIFEKHNENSEAVVRIATKFSFSSVIVRPLSAGVTPTIGEQDGQRYVELKIKKWGSYSVEFNGDKTNTVQIFVNPVYTSGQYGGTYVPLGTARGDIHGGSVYGSGVVYASGGAPVWSMGNGNRVHGITLLNGGENVRWTIDVNSVSDVKFDYFHIISSCKNGDGISIQSSSNINITNSYFRTWDDAVVLKIYTGNDVTDITVDNSVFWSDLAQALEIGAETNKNNANSSPLIQNVKFTNIDIIHANHKPALSIHNMDNAMVDQVTYHNITIEDASMGHNTGTNGDGWPILIDITNVKGGEVPGTAPSWSTSGDERGTIQNITFEDIKVLNWKNDVGKKPGIRILYSERGDGGRFGDITIKGLRYLEPNGSVTQINSVDALNNSNLYNQFSNSTHDGQYGSCTGVHDRVYNVNQLKWETTNLSSIINPADYIATLASKATIAAAVAAAVAAAAA